MAITGGAAPFLSNWWPVSELFVCALFLVPLTLIIVRLWSSVVRVLQGALGFTRVFRLLQLAQKVLAKCSCYFNLLSIRMSSYNNNMQPIIGHNLLSDLMLMYEKFHKPLPGVCVTCYWHLPLHFVFWMSLSSYCVSLIPRHCSLSAIMQKSGRV